MKLEQVVPWGRSFNEYKDMFSLTETDLKKFILGCGDGPASFNALLTKWGGRIISVDPLYQFRKEEIQSRIAQVYDEIMPQIHLNKDKYVWDRISSARVLGDIRMSAMREFIADYELGVESGRYVNQALPQLSFADNQFDLALCSHYLFLYSEHVNLEQHVASVKELCRVSKELRIYPLLTLDGESSPHLNSVIEAMNRLGYKCSQVDVEYQFQKGATQMLVVKPA